MSDDILYTQYKFNIRFLQRQYSNNAYTISYINTYTVWIYAFRRT